MDQQQGEEGQRTEPVIVNNPTSLSSQTTPLLNCLNVAQRVLVKCCIMYLFITLPHPTESYESHLPYLLCLYDCLYVTQLLSPID